MPTLGEVDNMLALSDKQSAALQRMRAAVMEQQHIHADQMARDQGKNIDYDGDEGSMYSDEMKGNYGGSDAKKRRGVSFFPLILFHLCKKSFYKSIKLSNAEQRRSNLAFNPTLDILSLRSLTNFLIFSSVPLRQVDVTAATEPKLPNGEEVLMARGLCVMHADYTMQS